MGISYELFPDATNLLTGLQSLVTLIFCKLMQEMAALL
jgi:hypothetical protein